MLSCIIGNALEWYDFALYGCFSTVLARHFFPSFDPFTSLMSTFGVFAAGFIARPLGGIIFGRIGDQKGRKKALLWSIYLMSFPTALIGLLPTYEQVGWWAPFFLTVIRLFQGFAIGGEFTGSMVFIVESCRDQRHRGFYGSWAPFGLVFGIFLGSVVAIVLAALLSEDALMAWGWRLPFLVSVLGGVVGSYIRKSLKDTLAKSHGVHASPLRFLLKNHFHALRAIFLVDFVIAIGFYIMTAFIISYFEVFRGFSKEISLISSLVSMCVFLAVVPLGGLLSDRMGRRRLMAIACGGLLVMSYPIFKGIALGSVGWCIACHGLFALFLGLYFAPLAAVLVESLPQNVRYSGLSFAHNMSMSFFGGTAPIVAGWLIHATERGEAPGFYLMAGCVLSFLGLLLIKKSFDTTHEPSVG